MSSNKSKNKNKKKKDFKGFLFVIFFTIGIVLGYFVTNYFIDKFDEARQDGSPAIKEVDITTRTEYQDLINDLYDVIKEYPEFYTTKGINIDDMDDNLKFRILYDSVIESQKYSSEILNTLFFGANTCENDFLADYSSDGISLTSTCSVFKITLFDLTSVYKEVFGKDNLKSVPVFYPFDNKKCVLISGDYYCGNIMPMTGVTGDLDTRFTITKVIKDTNGDIRIYDKGYLIDNRSNIAKIEGVDNYYLHSSDATSHYYELKSADNITFEHLFKVNEKNKYYYYSTSVLKK